MRIQSHSWEMENAIIKMYVIQFTEITKDYQKSGNHTYILFEENFDELEQLTLKCKTLNKNAKP
jgi:hypothetical protein